MNIEEKEKYVIDKIKQKYDIKAPEIAKMLLVKCEGAFKTNVGKNFIYELQQILETKQNNKKEKYTNLNKKYKIFCILCFIISILCFVSAGFEVKKLKYNPVYSATKDLYASTKQLEKLNNGLVDASIKYADDYYQSMLHNEKANIYKKEANKILLKIWQYRLKPILLFIFGNVFTVIGIIIQLKIKKIKELRLKNKMS